MLFALCEGRGGEFLLDLSFRSACSPPPPTCQTEEQEDDHNNHNDEDAFWLHAQFLQHEVVRMSAGIGLSPSLPKALGNDKRDSTLAIKI